MRCLTGVADRVPCPHCGRKFNQKAAERHIPRCQEIGTKPIGRAPMGAPSRGTEWMREGGRPTDPRRGGSSGGGGGGSRPARSSTGRTGTPGGGTRRR